MTRMHVYVHGGQWYFRPYSRAITGLWIASQPVSTLAANDDIVRKAQHVLSALGSSHDSVPLPSSHANLSEPLLELAGVRSWASFAKRAKAVAVSFDNNRFTVTPYRKNYGGKAFVEMLDKSIELAGNADANAIGAALQQAMALAE